MAYNFKGKVSDKYKKRIMELKEQLGFDTNAELIIHLIDNYSGDSKDEQNISRLEDKVDDINRALERLIRDLKLRRDGMID